MFEYLDESDKRGGAMKRIADKDEARKVLREARKKLNDGDIKFDNYVVIKKKCKKVLLAK